MPYNLTLDVPSNRAVVDRLREMDEWVDLRPQYVATNIQPDHFPDRMLVGGGFDDGRFLQMGTNNRNTPYNHFATMATPSAGKLTLKKAAKAVGKVAKPVAKFTYKEIVKPVAMELKDEGVKLAKEMLKEAIKSALSSEGSSSGAGRKPRGRGRKPKSVGGNVYPAAQSAHGNQRWAGKEGNLAAVVSGVEMMALPSDSQPIVPFVSKRGRGRPKGCGSGGGSGGSSGGGSGGKFNLKKALAKTGKVAKTVGVVAGRELLPVAIGAVGQEFGVPMPVGEAVGRVITKRALSEKNTGVKGGKKPKMIACGKSDGRAKRAEIVKKVMKERGCKMIEASKIVKAEGLY
jgi:hypothetical protein